MKNTVYHDIEVNGELNIAGGGTLGENLQALIVELINRHKYDDDENVYISTNPTSPAAKRGGTWERIKDVFLLAAGDTYSAGNTGGEATHTLTVSEMPRHTHAYGHSHESMPSNTGVVASGGAQFPPIPELDTTAVGNSNPHNNMPPYLAVYVWRKIS